MADQLTPTETTVLPQVRDWLSRPRQLFIGGRWVDAVSGETIDPATGQVLTTVAKAAAADVELAVKAARTAIDGEWSR
jgi:acyl-CoA reductase-like NAD-dependent aldehyde dehydrogenase